MSPLIFFHEPADNSIVNDSRLVLRDLAIALGVLALVFASLVVWASLTGKTPQLLTSYLDPDASPPGEPVPLISPEPVKEEVSRYIIGEHTVIGGESFSMITGKYWEDVFLWPDLYVMNDMKSGDPDLIYPDEIVDIYNRLGRGNTFSPTEEKMILDAYIKVYHRYKALGPEKNSSTWTLLWCGAKYNHDFLDLYASQIDPKDLVVARKYIEEEGFLD